MIPGINNIVCTWHCPQQLTQAEARSLSKEMLASAREWLWVTKTPVILVVRNFQNSSKVSQALFRLSQTGPFLVMKTFTFSTLCCAVTIQTIITPPCTNFILYTHSHAGLEAQQSHVWTCRVSPSLFRSKQACALRLSQSGSLSLRQTPLFTLTRCVMRSTHNSVFPWTKVFKNGLDL